MKMDLDDIDDAPMDALNQIVWQASGVKGRTPRRRCTGSWDIRIGSAERCGAAETYSLVPRFAAAGEPGVWSRRHQTLPLVETGGGPKLTGFGERGGNVLPEACRRKAYTGRPGRTML